MSHENQEVIKGLPENAHRELNPGETYEPIMSPTKVFPEVTGYSVFLGLVMAVIFSAAAAYAGLKIGQVFEAAIPIAIIAVGVSYLTKKVGALGQNVIIQSIGACSGVIVAGAIFTIPALYILQHKYPNIQVNFFQIFFSSLLGGILGILFLIPFRKYFVKDMHGKFPFPEATATTEILVTGEKGGKQAIILVVSGLIGGIYDFLFSSLRLWDDVVTTKILPYGHYLYDKVKMVFKLNVSSLIFSFGYLVGLRFSTIIAVGSMFSWLVLIPLIANIPGGTFTDSKGQVLSFASQPPEIIFKDYVRFIGIGAIAMAGIIGILRSSKVIADAFKLAVGSFTKSSAIGKTEELRTQKDIKMNFILMFIILTALAIFVFLIVGVQVTVVQAVVALATILIVSFLFTTVAANAIAIVGTNPVSGMTLMTLILSSFILVGVGLKGWQGMVSSMIIGGIVCTALSMAGGFITDLKIGYWLGSSPYKQQSWKFLGTLLSAATVGIVIFILANSYGFTSDDYLTNQKIMTKEEIQAVKNNTADQQLIAKYELESKNAKPLVAPQANTMAAVIEPLMMKGASFNWILFIVGALISVLMYFIGISPLAFALGMFIPLDLNTPLLVGGLIAHFVKKSSKDENLVKARYNRGNLIASGFIAGAAIFGVIGALLLFFGVDLNTRIWGDDEFGPQITAFITFVLLISYFIWDTYRAKVDE